MKNHVENSKKFELDKLLIKKIYNIQEKPKPDYKVIKKNVVYDKQLTRQYFPYSNINKDNYFCNYQSFRDYLSSGYDYYFLINEMDNIRSVLDISRNIREIVNKKILNSTKSHKKHPLYQTQEKIDEINNSITNQLNQKLNNINSKNIQPLGSNSRIRRPSTPFQIEKDNPFVKRLSNMAHKNSIANQNNNYNQRLNGEQMNNKLFIEKCRLLKKKEEEQSLPKNQYHFRLYSMLSEEFDKFYLPVYEDFINVKYENQKNTLIDIYNKEKSFTNSVTQMKEKIKLFKQESKMKLKINQGNESENIDFSNIRPNINPINNVNINQDSYETKVPYINSFFFGRSELYFKEIDNFMSMYKEKTSLASKQLEKDFFENLYKILTFNNTDCKKFFHYLYSNSYFFKYIYNIFTTNNKSDDTLKNIAPSIKRHNDDEPFLNESQKESFFPGAREKIIDENKYVIVQKRPDDEDKVESEEDQKQKEINEFFDSLIGNEFIYQISLIQEDVSELVDKKKTKKFRKIITSNERFEDNFIITLNNEDNMLQIYNTKENQYLFSFYFDENISFYDLDKDLKNNLKSDKIQKNQKYILVIQKNNFSNYNNSYVFKLSKDIYTRFVKSISSKGNKIKKIELFSSEEKEGSNNNEKEEEKKLKLEDVLSLQGDLQKNEKESESQESEKPSSSKNSKQDNNIKFDQRNPSRSISFRKNSANKSNSGNEKSENEEKEQKRKNDSKKEVKEKEGKEEEENEEDEDNEYDDNEENEEDEDNEDNDEEERVGGDLMNNKNKKISSKKEKSEEEENSEKDNINNNLSDEKKSEGRDNEKNNNKKLKNLEEEINTDIKDDPIFNNNPTIESKAKSSSDKEV